MQPINLFFYTCMIYNKLIKGNVHGRYLSREINKKRRISKTKAKSKIKNEITEKSERRSIKMSQQTITLLFHCVYDH